MSIQGITVDYTDAELCCQICNCRSCSNGSMITTDDCNHTFHVSCLIDHISKHKNMICPKCCKDVYDIRLSLAVAYKHNDVNEFIDALAS